MADSELAAAIAFFEASDDAALLQEVLRSIRPRAAAEVRRYQQSGKPVPAPTQVPEGEQPADREAALLLVKSVKDFADLQALSRAIGRRMESLHGA